MALLPTSGRILIRRQVFEKENDVKDEGRMVKFVVAGLVIAGLLMASNAIRSAAWTQGYTMGLLTSGADNADLVPYLLYRTGPGPQAGVGFFGSIVRLGFLMLLAFGIFRFMSFRYLGKHGGPPPWMRRHGPWCSEAEDGAAHPAAAEGAATDRPGSPQSVAPVSG